MRTAALFTVLVTASAASHAVDINGYETFLKQSESREPSAQPFVAKAFLKSYFIGMAETLQFLQVGTQTIRMGERKFICFPPEIKISGELLEAILTSEIRRGDFYAEKYGPKWKEVSVSNYVGIGLARTFPCPSE